MRTNLITTLFFACIFIGYSYGQEVQEPEKPLKQQPGMFSASFGVSGMVGNISIAAPLSPTASPQLFLRYFLNEKFALRMGLSPSIRSSRVSTVDSVGKDLVEYDSTNRQSSVGIHTGIEYHFKGTRRLDPYIGLDLSFDLIGTEHSKSSLVVTDTTGAATTTRTITQDGGYAIGVGGLIGANYFIAEHVYLGASYGLRFSSIAIGGDRQDVLQTVPVSGSETIVRTLSSARNTTTGLNVDGIAMVHLGFLFGGRGDNQ